VQILVLPLTGHTQEAAEFVRPRSLFSFAEFISHFIYKEDRIAIVIFVSQFLEYMVSQ